MPWVKKTQIERKRSYDYAPFQQNKAAKRRRLTTSASTAHIDHAHSTNSNISQSPYAFCSPEREDLSSFLTDDRLVRSAKRRLSYNVKRPVSTPSVSKQVSFQSEPKQSARVKSRKRPIGQVLDDSVEEAVVIKGRPASKKHKKVLSDSMQEAFYLTSSDESDSESECDKSADDIFIHPNEKENRSVAPPRNVVRYENELPTVRNQIERLSVGCTLTSCRKHNNPDKHPECCSHPYIDCEYRPKPVVCPIELERLVNDCEENKCLFPSYSTEYYTVLKEVDFGNGRSPSVYLYGKSLLTLCNKQQRTLHVDRTFNLGNCLVTMFVFRNTNLVDSRSKKKYSPLMTGPVMLHFDVELETYTRFFEHVKDKTGIEFDFKPELNRKLTKRDKVIGGAIRNVFGTGVPLCDNYHQPGHTRNTLRQKVKCFDSLYRVIEQLTFVMNCERSESKRCLEKRSIWKMVPRAKAFIAQYMDTAFPMKYLDELSLSPE